jgi:tetratricopeptide (TPR) repeat protein
LLTRLQRFLKERGLKYVDVARESGYSRQHLLRLRSGRMEPTRRCIAALVAAVSRLTRSKVRPEDLFVLSYEAGGAQEQQGESETTVHDEKRSLASARLLVRRLEKDGPPQTQWLAILEAKGADPLAAATALFERGRELTFASPRTAEERHRLAAEIAGKIAAPTTAGLSIRGWAHMGRGNALAQLGEYDQAFAAFDKVERVLTRSPDCLHELAQVWYSRARTFTRRTAYDRGREWIDGARVVFQFFGDDRMTALVQLLEGAILYETGHPAEAETVLHSTIEPLTRARDHASVAFAWLDIGRCNIDLGNVPAARMWLEKARSRFSRLGLRSETTRAQWCLGWLRALHEDRQDGLVQLSRARRAFVEMQMPTESASSAGPAPT